jgi:ZIP family zinc transporter
MKVMPDVLEIGRPIGILAGFIAGGLSMIALKWLVKWLERRGTRRPALGLVLAATADTFIDGAIIGAGFSASRELGLLLTAALGLELFFVTLSVGSELHRTKSRRLAGILTTSGIALLLPIGAGAQHLVFHDASQTTIATVLSFGAAALIYLVAEELLVESIEAEESLLSTAMLYAGFVTILVFELLERRRA